MSMNKKRRRELIVQGIELILGFMLVAGTIFIASLLLKWAGVL